MIWAFDDDGYKQREKENIHTNSSLSSLIPNLAHSHGEKKKFLIHEIL